MSGMTPQSDSPAFPPFRSPSSLNDALAVVSQARGIPAENMFDGQQREKAHARQELAYLCRYALGCTLTCISAFIGRDHTTVVHSIRSVEQRMRSILGYDAQIAAMEAELVVEVPVFKSSRRQDMPSTVEKLRTYLERIERLAGQEDVEAGQRLEEMARDARLAVRLIDAETAGVKPRRGARR